MFGSWNRSKHPNGEKCVGGTGRLPVWRATSVQLPAALLGLRRRKKFVISSAVGRIKLIFAPSSLQHLLFKQCKFQENWFKTFGDFKRKWTPDSREKLHFFTKMSGTFLFVSLVLFDTARWNKVDHLPRFLLYKFVFGCKSTVAPVTE